MPVVPWRDRRGDGREGGGRMSESKIAYWGRVDDERLRHETMHDAVEDILDGLPEPLPSHITVFGYARVIIDPFSLNVLDDLIEQLDVEYGDPERCNEVTSTTAAMRRAEHEFVAAVLAEYEPWACQR